LIKRKILFKIAKNFNLGIDFEKRIMYNINTQTRCTLYRTLE